MSPDNLRVGRLGEEEALGMLKQNGYRILARNYRTRLGEVDIVASDRETFCFIEVKARRTGRCGSPAESVSLQKQRQISKAALQFIKEKRLWGRRARFDVVSVKFDGPDAKTELIKNAFTLDERYSI